MDLTLRAIKVEKKDKRFDLYKVIIDALRQDGTKLQDGNVLVVSSKFISNSQGRIIDLDRVRPSENAVYLSEKFQIALKIAEVITRESDNIFGGIAGFVIASSDNIMAPNAGIDKSNVKKGKVILYPNNPYLLAEQLKRKIFLEFMIHVGVIIVDSRLMPARVGTTGVAISCAGIEPVEDMRAQKDLDGNPLKVTLQAVVDNLATIANHKMGEGAQSKPFAIIKNSGAKLTDRKIKYDEMTVSHDQCVYVRGLGNSN